MRPDFSLDGKKVAFESNRRGFGDIWTCGSNRSNRDQVTSLRGTSNGRCMAFEFHLAGRGEIYVVEVPARIVFLAVDRKMTSGSISHPGGAVNLSKYGKYLTRAGLQPGSQKTAESHQERDWEKSKGRLAATQAPDSDSQ
jgi:hypothetical protein